MKRVYMQNSKEFILNLKALDDCFSLSNSKCQSLFLDQKLIPMFRQETTEQRLELLQALLENKKPSRENIKNNNHQNNESMNQTNFIDSGLKNENTRRTIILILWELLILDVKEHFNLRNADEESTHNIAKLASINAPSIMERAKKDGNHRHSLDYLLFKNLKDYVLFDKVIFAISPMLLDPKLDWESTANDSNELLIIQKMIKNSYEYIVIFIRDEFKGKIINLDFFQYFLHIKIKTEKKRLMFLGIINEKADLIIKEIVASVEKYNPIKSLIILLIKEQQLLKTTINKKDIFPQLVLVLSCIFAERILHSIFRHMSSYDNILADLKKQLDSDLITFELISSYFLDMPPNISDLKKGIQKKYNYYTNIEKFNFTTDWDLFEKLVKEHEKNLKNTTILKGQTSFGSSF